MHLAVAVNLGSQIVGQRVHAAYADTVQTAGHLIRTLVELTTGVKHCQNDLKSRLVHLFMHVYRYASAIVNDLDGIVLKNAHFYMAGKTGESLVDRVVDHLVNQMMQAAHACVADIHRRTFAHRLKSLKHLDIIRLISFLFFFCCHIVQYLCQSWF